MRAFHFACVLAVTMTLTAGTGLAVDQMLVGRKLLIRTPPSGTANNKVLLLSRDRTQTQPTVADPAEDPTLTGGRLRVSGAGGDFTIALPAAGWTYNGRLYRYRDPTGATCKVVLIKDARIEKAVCKGPQVAYTLGAAQGSVYVILATGTARRFCHEFDGDGGSPVQCNVVKDGSDGKTYLARICGNAGTGCASASGAFVDGDAVF